MLKRICRLLLPDERKMGIRVVCAVFLCALLDFAGLAALLPVLFFLLDDGRDKDAALLFCLVAIVFILVKNALAAGLSRFQNHFLMSLYRRLSFSLFTSYYQRGLLFIRSRGYFHRDPFSRSYGVNLPSSLTVIHSSTLGYSPRPPVSVYGTGDIYYNLEDFLGSRLGCTIKLPVGSLYCQVSARTNS